jgi:DNA-binding protein HU-beta
MNKGDLATAVAGRTGLSRQAANEAVEAVFMCIGEAMRKGEEVRVLGFGSFVVTDRTATTGRNPKTGEPLEIKASKQAKFRPGKGLKDALNL